MAEQSFKLGLSTKALGKNNGPYEPTAYIEGMGVWDGASVARKHAALWQAASELIAAVFPLAPRLTLPLALALTLTLALTLALTVTLTVTVTLTLTLAGVPRVPLDDGLLQQELRHGGRAGLPLRRAAPRRQGRVAPGGDGLGFG